jgi:hypothetical protein
MSEPVAVSPNAIDLISPGQRRSAIQPVPPRRANSHRIHHVLFPNPFPTQQTARAFQTGHSAIRQVAVVQSGSRRNQ